MHGNLWEHCQDEVSENPLGRPGDPRRLEYGERHVLCGGCYYGSPESCFATSRYAMAPDGISESSGFRVVLMETEETAGRDVPKKETTDIRAKPPETVGKRKPGDAIENFIGMKFSYIPPGTTTKYNCGNNDEALKKAEWYSGNHNQKVQGPSQVGQKKANPWGLYDMHGSVSEMCADWFGPYVVSGSIEVDPKGPPTGRMRVLRGGFWNRLPKNCRSACRYGSDPAIGSSGTGFRVVMEP